MKDLLEAIKDRLDAQVSPLSVSVVPADDYLPNSVRPPFCGLKDGGLTRRDLAGGMVEETLRVRVWVYDKDASSKEAQAEAAIDIRADVDEVLQGWTPDDFILGGDLVEQSPSEMVGRAEKGPYFQRAGLVFEYIREV